MPSRIRPEDQNGDDYYPQHDYGRRHRSQPPKKNRVKEEDRPQRPKFAKDDSYYNPRDKYYLSGEDEPDFHPYFAKHRDDSPPPRRRQESPPRRRHESTPRHTYESPPRYESPTRHASPPPRRRARSRDRRRTEPQPELRSRSSEDRRHQRYVDEENDRHSRRSPVGSSRHRTTTVPPPRSHHDDDRGPDRRPSRRETDRSHRYPPSSSKPSSRPHRSSTLPAHSRRPHSRSTSTSPPAGGATPKHELFMGAARAAMEAGAMAALKLTDDPGPWVGKKGTKVLTTALGAAMVDGLIEQRKPDMKGGMRHGIAKQVATFALGSLVTKPAAKHGLGGHHLQKGM